MKSLRALALSLALLTALPGCIGTPDPPADHVPPLGDNNDSGITDARKPHKSEKKGRDLHTMVENARPRDKDGDLRDQGRP